MKKLLKKITLFSLLVAGSLTAFAQETARNEQMYNPHSVRPVRQDQIMFKKSLWLRLDLRQKVNTGMYADGNEITRLLIDAVKSDVIKPYRNDSLATRMSKEEFLDRLSVPVVEEDDAFAAQQDFDQTEEDAWGDALGEDQEDFEEVGPIEYLPRQLYIVEIKEDLIFDKHESRMKHDIQAVTIIIPAEQTRKGLDVVLGSFSYKELVDKVFTDNPQAIWYNSQNQAKHLNLAHAFDSRLFHGQLVKYENPKNNMIVDLYEGGKRALAESQRIVHSLVEYEALLWEY